MRAREKKRERRAVILLAVLGLALCCLAYYVFVYRGVEAEILRQRAALADTLLALQSAEAKAAEVRRMEAELREAESSEIARMESYDAGEAELAFLNRILDDAIEYTVTFHQLSRDGDQVRRGFSLDFTADSFLTAMRVIQRLEGSRYRCILGDVSYAARTEGENRRIHVSTEATFFETMKGASEDAVFPMQTGK